MKNIVNNINAGRTKRKNTTGFLNALFMTTSGCFDIWRIVNASDQVQTHIFFDFKNVPWI